MKVPDILFDEPVLRVDEDAILEVLGFAFATGKAPQLLESHLVDDHTGDHSPFDEQCFAEDLFLKDLVADCFPLKGFRIRQAVNMQYFYRHLCNPPKDLSVITFRQEILKELLAEPNTLEKFKELYAALRRLVWAFDTSSFGVSLDLTEFRMDVIQALMEVVHIMRDGFADAKSGLVRIAEAGREVAESEAYRELTDLLDYENRLSSVDVRIRVGAAGDLRGFRVKRIAENEENRFYSNPWQRFVEKGRLWMRGYRFRDADLVAQLVSDVFKRLEHKVVNFVQLLGQVEFYLVVLGFREKMKEHGLETCLPEFGAAPAQWRGLFNPLLLRQEIRPVAGDLLPERADNITLVTGPNSGGKTRFLQAIGIAQLMGQNGMFVPAASARMRVVNGLFASLRELDGVDATEGRLGTELARIHTAFRKSPYGSMLLLDELCSGTNPSEGSEIVSLVLEMLAGLHPQAYITTHFLDYVRSMFASASIPNLEFLQVELNNNEQPTYRFVKGVATTSLARKIADRLGVSRGELEMLVSQKRNSAPQATPLRVIA